MTRYGVYFVDPAFDWSFAPVHVISYNIGPRYNGAQLYWYNSIIILKRIPDGVSYGAAVQWIKSRSGTASTPRRLYVEYIINLGTFSYQLLGSLRTRIVARIIIYGDCKLGRRIFDNAQVPSSAYDMQLI